MKTRFATLRASGVSRNALFDLEGPFNRDDCLVPYHQLKTEFARYGIEVNTPDLNSQHPVAFELHLNVQSSDHPHCYLLQMETGQILPGNFDPHNLNRYRRIFTWHDGLVDGQRYIKLNFPNALKAEPQPGFAERKLLACMISANKAVSTPSPDELYSQRVNTIRWFERYAPQDFALYGIGWHLPQRKAGTLGSLIFKVRQRFPWLNPAKPFPSYRGPVDTKASVLRRTKFSICYENVQKTPGYITEKIFDCFLSGCVPVYWGAPNITDYIPADCFIDRQAFDSHEALYQHLVSMQPAVYAQYQTNILRYLASDQSSPFGAGFFADTLVRQVLQDLEAA
ncbi:MAG TPA: glycosyltransferase family 10 [Limnobacter sp.]|uniref:glycosyltransferase family 10 domain-containing protein n=1 Tax=Limnobacter sp. TaxID=2003368 RepID=UPI002ED87962